MKSLTIIKASILVLMAGFGSNTSAQESASVSVSPPVFGFGFKVAQISLSELMDNAIPGNKLLMTISPHRNFRVEGSFGYLSQKYENDRGTEIPGKSLFYGLSFFGMWQKGNTNFYAGPRVGFLNYSQEDEQMGYNSSTGQSYYYTVTSEGKSTTLGGVIGVEYFFSRHFTIGGEISINTIKYVNKQPAGVGQTGNSETSSKAVMTETGLVLRFYF